MTKMKKFAFVLCLAATIFTVYSCGKDTGSGSSGGGGNEKVPADWKEHIFDDDLFDRFVDPETGVVSYLLKHDILGPGLDNSQSTYFTHKEMTNDERFVYFYSSTNEWHGAVSKVKSGGVIDLALRKIYEIPKIIGGGYPYMDPENDVIYWCERAADKRNARFYKMDLLKNPGKRVALAYFPEKLRPAVGQGIINRVCSHLTLTQDKQQVLLDAWVGNNFYQGLLNLYTGEYTKWASNNNQTHYTHGQMNPHNDNEALFAIDSWTDSFGTDHKFADIGWDAETGMCKRMQIATFANGKATFRTVETHKKDGKYQGASHDTWSEDGNTIYWCSGGLWKRNIRSWQLTQVYNLKSPRQWYDERCTHGNLTSDQKYLTCDKEANYKDLDTPYRGNAWSVSFYNTTTNKELYIFTRRPQITDAQHESTLHPDPHPHFVCNGKYIICTVADAPYQHADGDTYNDLHLAITPVDQLVKKTQ